MRKTILILLITLLLSIFIIPAQAQRSYIRSKIRHNIEQDMEKKYAEPQQERGRKAIRDNTYENDTRYPTPENRVKATLVMTTKTFKKNGLVKSTMTSKIVFGPTGECMIMNEGDKKETRMLFDYEGAANYMINEKDKTAMKMPMVNFTKMIERMSKNQPDADENNGRWQKTLEQKTINGYNCQKYIYTDENENHMNVWVTQDINIDLSGNHLFGSNIKNYAAKPGAKADKNLPRGLMIRNVYYEKNASNPSMQMDISSLTKSFDQKYFDLSRYEVTDILGKL